MSLATPRPLDEGKFTILGNGIEVSVAKVAVVDFATKSATVGSLSGPSGTSQAATNCLTLLCIEHLLGYMNPSSTKNIQDYPDTATSTLFPGYNMSADTKSDFGNTEADYGLLARAAVVFLASVPGFLLVLVMTLGEIFLFGGSLYERI
jgi:hypothetical protein